MEENLTPGNEGTGTQTEAGNSIPASEQGQKPVERTFTKDEVNELMKKRVERSHNSFFTRYGVKDLNELDNLVGQSRSYGPLKERFDELEKNHNELTLTHKDLAKKYAYKTGNIDEGRIADIETYFKGKGIEIDESTLAEELKTHPEWAKKAAIVRSIGAEATPSPSVDERELASKYFGVNLKKRR